MDEDVQEYMEMESCSLNVDGSLFSTSKEEEVILCLNYDGLYGINNINRFLQESNPNPSFHWDIQCYKVGDYGYGQHLFSNLGDLAIVNTPPPLEPGNFPG